MRITEAQLRDIIKTEVKRFRKYLNEEVDVKPLTDKIASEKINTPEALTSAMEDFEKEMGGKKITSPEDLEKFKKEVSDAYVKAGGQEADVDKAASSMGKGGNKKAGTEGAKGTEGTLDVKKIADTLGLDSEKLKLAVTDLKRNKRSAAHDKMFGDVFAKLMGASESDTVKVMNVLKKVEAAE